MRCYFSTLPTAARKRKPAPEHRRARSRIYSLRPVYENRPATTPDHPETSATGEGEDVPSLRALRSLASSRAVIPCGSASVVLLAGLLVSLVVAVAVSDDLSIVFAEELVGLEVVEDVCGFLSCRGRTRIFSI